MNHVRIKVNDKAYAIESSCVMEIVPLVTLEPPGEHDYFYTGKMHYHGDLVPVIDLCMLLAGRPHQNKFSTRILITQIKSKRIGLIAESVTDLVPEQEINEKLELEALLAGCI